MFLRDMIQGYQNKEFYKKMDKQGKRVTKNLIKYNQDIMRKDFKNQTQRINEYQFGTNTTKDISVLNATLRDPMQKTTIIGHQIKLCYNDALK